MGRDLKLLKIVLAIAIFLTLAILSAAQDGRVVSTKKPYARAGNQATLSGSITFTGKRPKERIIDMSADPACYQVNADPCTEWAVGNKGKLANVFVYVKSEGLDSYTFEPPTSPAQLEHRGCRYVPHVLGMQLGQPLLVFNRDPTTHNTHQNPKNNPEWNQSQPPGFLPLTITLKVAETFIPFKDNQHPWQKAYVGVFAHPFFAISDPEGNFRIEGVPAGSYKVVAWHERFGEKTIDIVFVPGESRYLSFNFDANDADLSRPGFTY